MAFKMAGFSAFTKITDEEKEAGVDRKYKRLMDRKKRIEERGMKKASKGKYEKAEKLYEKADTIHDKAAEHRQGNL